MFRSIMSIVLGFVTMAITAVMLTIVLMLIAGTDALLRPGSFHAAPLWLVGGFIISGAAGTGAGLVCLLVAPRPSHSPLVLAIIVFVFGIGEALLLGTKTDPGPRGPDAQSPLAIAQMIEPAWFRFSRPPAASLPILLLAIRASRKGPKS